MPSAPLANRPNKRSQWPQTLPCQAGKGCECSLSGTEPGQAMLKVENWSQRKREAVEGEEGTCTRHPHGV